jgi:hypothetical protein
LNGVMVDSSSTVKSTVTSAATANAVTPAIQITGRNDSATTTGTDQRGIWIGLGSTISATGGGDISLTGTNSTTLATNPGAIYIEGADIIASTGYVRLDGGTRGVVASISSNTTNLGALSSGTATGAVTVVGDRITSAGTSVIKTSGAVVLEPSSASFAATFNASSLSVTAGAASLRIAKDGNTSDITLSAGSISVLGNIDIFGAAVTSNASLTTTSGGNITINASGAYTGTGALNANGNVVINSGSFGGTGALTSAGAGGIAVTASNGSVAIGANLSANSSAVAPIVLKASANLSVTASRSITTAGGNAILWSRYLAAADAVTVGNITLGNSVTITTNGGRIAMAGTSQVDANGIPTGYAYTTSTTAAVQLGTSATAADANVLLISGGGAITIFGQQASAANSSSGIQIWGGASINAGTGRITMDGRSASNGGNAIEFTGTTGGFKVLSAATTGTAISITGAATGTPGANGGSRGIGSWDNGLLINASGGGNVSLVGSQTSANTTNPGGILLTGGDVIASAGTVTINGNSGVQFRTNAHNLGATSATSASGNVTVIGDVIASRPPALLCSNRLAQTSPRRLAQRA